MATISGEVRDDNGDLAADVVVRAYRRDTGALLVAGVSGDGATPIVGDEHFASITALLHFEGSNDGTTFTDVIGHTVSRVGTNAVTSTTQKQFGTAALKITATSGAQGVSLADADDLSLGNGAFTMECWLYPTSASTSMQPFRKGASSGSYSGCFISIATTRAIQLLGTNNGSSWGLNATSATGAIALNAWSHVAIVRNGTTVSCYVNGTSVCSGTLSGTIADAAGAFYIGCGIDANPFVGYLDEFRMTKGVARYTANFTPPDAAFLDYYEIAVRPLGEYSLTTSYTDEVQVIALDPAGGDDFNDLILRTTPV